MEVHARLNVGHCQKQYMTVLRLAGCMYVYKYYSWIGHPVRTNKKIICCEIERATTNLKLRTKSTCRGASTGVGKINFLGELFLKNR